MMQDSEQEHVKAPPTSSVIMVPFDARFDGHGLTPHDVFGGKQASAGDPYGVDEESPASFSYEHFGFHPENSMIHAIDISKCVVYTPSDERDFYTLREKELTDSEKELPSREGNSRLISKCVRLVAVSLPQGVQYEPDSLVHDILVRVDGLGMPEWPRGELVYRSSMSASARQELVATHRLRPIPLGALDIPLTADGREETRKSRFFRLSKSMGKNIVDSSLPRFYTNAKASVANIGPVRLTGDEEYVRLNHLGPGNPGMDISLAASSMRTGLTLLMETDLPETSWGPRMARLNPLAYWLPPNIVNFYDLFLFPPVPELEVFGDTLKDFAGL